MTTELLLFNELTPKLVYRILKLRSEVFVVEQNCVYQDMDDLDLLPETRHLLFQEAQNVNAYARILAPGASYSGFSSIGRIVTSPDARGSGLGHALVEKAIVECTALWPQYAIKIGAQSHLTGFYGKHGFIAQGDEYIEDGIPHIHMVRHD